MQTQKGQISAPCGNSLDKSEGFRLAEHIQRNPKVLEEPIRNNIWKE